MSLGTTSSAKTLRRLSLLLLALGLIACSERDSPSSGDSDEGEMNEEQPELPEPFGPENSWWHADSDDVPADLAGTGWRTGDIAHDFILSDQHGDEVQLYQFYGKVIVLDVFAQWCPPCQENAPHGEDLWLEGNGDVIVLAATQQDYESNPPDNSDLNAWADTYSLTHPVLADPAMTQDSFVVTGYPTYVVIDQEMNVVNDDLWPFDGDYVLNLLD
ncbi:MAG TPA: hypothetical protein DIU15_19690 [Deltaproteobacteria bacterium]|nr:hypothetical protein [Deltaproteobacteria bacterium]HCP48271.1 hypothetical protein [Deltaproteobacteria bacterium]